MPTSRMEAFSDGVIAVIITIMVLELKALDRPTLAAILPLWPKAVNYAVSCLFVAIIWVNYHHLLHFVRFDSPRLIWINFARLFLVSLLPFATAWMARTRLAPAPVAAYAALFVLAKIAYLVFEREALAQADRSAVPERVRRLAQRRSLAGLAIFGVAALTAFVVPLLECAMICGALVLYMLPNAISSYRRCKPH